jgi:hypothetical protein
MLQSIKDPEYHIKITNIPMTVIGLINFLWGISLIVEFWLIGFVAIHHTFYLPVSCVFTYMGYRQGFEITKIDTETD